MTTSGYLYWCSFIVLVLGMPVAQAHGDNESTMSNSSILFICLISSVFAWSAGNEWLETNSVIGRPTVFCLGMFSGTVHLLLGLDDLILMVGGIGVIVILGASLVPNLKRFKVQLRFGLGSVISVMLIGYFATNHDLHYISEDYLGLITKVAEIGLLQQLVTNVDSLDS